MSPWQGAVAVVLSVVLVLATSYPRSPRVSGEFELSSPSTMRRRPTCSPSPPQPQHRRAGSLPKPDCAVRVPIVATSTSSTRSTLQSAARISIRSGAIDVATSAAANVFFLSSVTRWAGRPGARSSHQPGVWDRHQHAPRRADELHRPAHALRADRHHASATRPAIVEPGPFRRRSISARPRTRGFKAYRKAVLDAIEAPGRSRQRGGGSVFTTQSATACWRRSATPSKG